MSVTAICPVCGHELDAENPVGGSYEYQSAATSWATATVGWSERSP